MATDRILDPTETARTAYVNRIASILGITTQVLLQQYPGMKSSSVSNLKASGEAILLQYFGIPVSAEADYLLSGDYYKMRTRGKAIRQAADSNTFFLVPADAPDLPTGYGSLPFMTYKVIVGSLKYKTWWPTWYLPEGKNFEPNAEQLAYMMIHLQSWVNHFKNKNYDVFEWNSRDDKSGFNMAYLIYMYCCFNRLKEDKPWGGAVWFNLPVSKKISQPGWQYAFVYYDDVSSYWVNPPFEGDNPKKHDNFNRGMNAYIADATDYPYPWLSPFVYHVTSADRFWAGFEAAILAVSVWLARLIPIIGVPLGIVIAKVTEAQKVAEIKQKVKEGIISKATADKATELIEESTTPAGILKTWWERLVRLFQQYGMILLLPFLLLALGLYFLFKRKKHS